ncbi:MAG: nucleotide pyrophosphohydrolase [Planctomycetia bacterium]|nr:nucleotide pyrophosphohydrolase [Planctomycetia bacterium]
MTRDSKFQEAVEALRSFRDARDWKQFHTPRQLAAALAIEASELQQVMLWRTDDDVVAGLADTTLQEKLADELADILSFALLLAHDVGLDPAQLIQSKLERNELRYPVEKSRGRATKYTDL